MIENKRLHPGEGQIRERKTKKNLPNQLNYVQLTYIVMLSFLWGEPYQDINKFSR